MGAAFFVLAIVTIAIGIPVMAGMWSAREKERIRLRARELEVLGSRTAERAAQYAAQTERLEQRVRVLERIVTDRGFDLAAQIDQLDERPVQGRIEH
ncbi:MAG: hypothetical protein BGP16_06255 [Sphingobium sp. 66-54]|nr:MAG: hypothetical protein BGP16_06255 [Sphingobium sp. 66-54]